MFLRAVRPFRVSDSCQEAISDVREWSGDPSEFPEGPYEYLGVVGWPSCMSGSVREAVPDVRGGREAITNVQDWSGGPPECSVVVERPSRMSGSPSRLSGSDWKSLPDVREW